MIITEPIADIGIKTKIGKFTVIGSDGFGFNRDKFLSGEPIEVPHYGRVWIGDNVRIGSNCSVERATLPDKATIIESNVKIDNNVMIGHNSFIGEGTLIAAGTVIGGTVKIGKNCFIGVNVSIKQHVTIGDQVIVGIGSVVLNDIPDRDVIAGNPARSIKNKCNISYKDRFRMVGY